MAAFKRTSIIDFGKSAAKLSDDNIYWRDYDFPLTVKEMGQISSISFSPSRPFSFAVSCSTKVQIYDPTSIRAPATLSRFKRAAFGASFRSDGGLLSVGGEEGFLKIFSPETKTQLRLMKGHKGAIHATKFLNDKLRVASFSDDYTVRCWDVASEQELCSLCGHTDYVRCGVTAFVSSDLIVSGSYDHSARLWDLRSETETMKVEHGHPIEAVALFPSDSILFTAGGTVVKVWDVLAGGRLLAEMNNHHKTITCLTLCSQNKRLLSGSLDRHIKVYSLASYEVVHTIDFPAPLLAVGIAADDSMLAVGMTDGLLSIQKRKAAATPLTDADRRAHRNSRSVHFRLKLLPKRPDDLSVIPHETTPALAKYDKCIKKFQYSKALDCVLSKYFLSRAPQTTVSVFRELRRRNALRSSLAGRPPEKLRPLLIFLIRYITCQPFMRHLLDVVDIVLDLYGETLFGQPEDIKDLFRGLSKQISKEAVQAQLMLKALGSVETIISVSSNLGCTDDNTVEHEIIGNGVMCSATKL